MFTMVLVSGRHVLSKTTENDAAGHKVGLECPISPSERRRYALKEHCAAITYSISTPKVISHNEFEFVSPR